MLSSWFKSPPVVPSKVSVSQKPPRDLPSAQCLEGPFASFMARREAGVCRKSRNRNGSSPACLTTAGKRLDRRLGCPLKHIFTGISTRLEGKNSIWVTGLSRAVNRRLNTRKWTPDGAPKGEQGQQVTMALVSMRNCKCSPGLNLTTPQIF